MPEKETREHSRNSFASALFQRPLVDLGASGTSVLNGILSPLYDQTTVQQYIQSQFCEFAETYALKYQDTAYFSNLLSDVFRKIAINTESQLCILDVGSGSGNTIFPLLKLCPSAQIIASDLSIEMLLCLKAEIQKHNHELNMDRCTLMQLNAEDLDFMSESLDLIIGGSTLHHLIDPGKTIRQAYRILKKGGCCIFFEPFEEGNIILRSIYHAIIADPRQGSLPEDVLKMLRALILDYDTRLIKDKSGEIFRQLDDKWLFNKIYFFESANWYGYSGCIVYPLHETAHQFVSQTRIYLNLFGLSEYAESLPEWFWDIAGIYDRCFSEETKRDLLIEGCVVLKK